MRKTLTAVFILLNIVDISAQHTEVGEVQTFDPAFEVFELPGGALGNSVQGIVQDSVGYMWFASQGGLHRYDGQNIITYNHDPNNPNTIGSDYVEDIFLDSKGLIWLTHWFGEGLTSFDPDRGVFTRYVHDPDDPESIINGPTVALVEDDEGYMWVGGRGGLSRLDPATGKFKRFLNDPDNSNSLSDSDVRGLYVDRLGTLWVATGMPWDQNDLGGLNRYDPINETFTRFLHNPNDSTSIAHNKVRTLFEDSSGNFWVGTGGDGLHQFDRNSDTFIRFSYDPEDPGKLTRPYIAGQDPESTPYFSHITSIYEDRRGRIWITAVEGGLNVYDPASDVVSHFEIGLGEDKLGNNFLWQTFQSEDGTMWITSGGEGQTLYKVKEEKLEFPFFETMRLNGDSIGEVHGIVKDRNGKIWTGSVLNPQSDNETSVLWQLDPDIGEMKKMPFGFVEDSSIFHGFLARLSLDSAGNIWVGTGNKGSFVGNPDYPDFEHYAPVGIPPEFLVQRFQNPLQDGSGHIWFPSWGLEIGVLRLDPLSNEYEIFEHDPGNSKSIGGNLVWSFYKDKKGNFWLGGGTPWYNPDAPLFLDRYNPQSNTFEHFIKESIPSGIVSGIAEDLEGNIWFIDFSDGLYKLNPATSELKKFTPHNSLLPAGRLLSILPYSDGTIWISGENVIIELDPSSETMSIYDELHGVKPARRFFNAASVADDGELLFARSGGFHGFYPERFFSGMKDNLPDLRITGFRLLDGLMVSGRSHFEEGILEQPIWETSKIELGYNENVFSFAVACFDFYEPGANQIQFMLEGFDRGWRKDVREGETPSYINVAPGEYTFRLRGASSLGVWNKEGISMQVVIHPPWWTTWWAYILYGLIFICGVFIVDRVQRKRLLRKAHTEAREKELEQAREIEKAYNELKTTQSQLIQSEKMASLGELTAGIAHEIQNPLNFVNNFSDVNSELVEELKEEIDKGNTTEAKSIADDIGENEKKIVHHGKRAEEIVRSMLQHSRGSEGKKEPTDINTLADEYLRLAYHGMRAKDKSFNVTMDTQLDPNLGEIEVVPQDIGRVILNLITNAFFAVNERKTSVLREPQESEASENGYQPVVSVTTKKSNGRVEIDVKDNGAGIPEDIKKKIFQPFFSTKGTGKGTGLGLSLSYDIITKGHGGSIEVESKEGEGTEFKIFLPVK